MSTLILHLSSNALICPHWVVPFNTHLFLEKAYLLLYTYAHLMNKNDQNGEILQSWKEIAAYLGCDPRTCRRWEKQLDLPVRRIGKGDRPRIIAFKKDLNEWLNSTGQQRTDLKKPHILKKLKILPVLLAVGIAAVLIWVVWVTIFEPKIPADFRIAGSRLVILDINGTTLWRHDTGIENLCNQNTYEEHFQFKRIAPESGERLLPHLIIKDIDGDRKPEVLFTTQTQNEFKEGKLTCFDADGKKMWHFEAGRQIKFGTTVYTGDYRIKGIDICDFDKDGTSEILVISRHRNHFPNQIALLDSTGRMMGEYWHSGYLIDYGFLDIDDDRNEEIFLGGCNNEYKKGCVVVLEHDNIQGGSPQTGEYRCSQLDEGTEKYYVLLPRTDVAKNQSGIGSINSIDILKSNKILVEMRFSRIYFEFNQDLSLHSINISHGYKKMYEDIFGTTTSMAEHQAKTRSELRDKILYYDGSDWVNYPASVK